MGSGSSSEVTDEFKKQWVNKGPLPYGGSLYGNQLNPREQVEHHQLTSLSSDLHQEETELFKMRQRSPVLVAGEYLRTEQDKEMCSSDYQGDLYTERIPVRLSNITEVPYPSSMHIYSHALSGFEELYRKEGPFAVSQEHIGINNHSVVKVWMNHNYSKSYPNSRVGSEGLMVEAIIRVIDTNCDPDTHPPQAPSIGHFILRNQKTISFNQAQRRLQEYSRTFGSPIPARLDCIEQMGGVSRLERAYKGDTFSFRSKDDRSNYQMASFNRTRSEMGDFSPDYIPNSQPAPIRQTTVYSRPASYETPVIYNPTAQGPLAATYTSPPLVSAPVVTTPAPPAPVVSVSQPVTSTTFTPEKPPIIMQSPSVYRNLSVQHLHQPVQTHTAAKSLEKPRAFNTHPPANTVNPFQLINFEQSQPVQRQHSTSFQNHITTSAVQPIQQPQPLPVKHTPSIVPVASTTSLRHSQARYAYQPEARMQVRQSQIQDVRQPHLQTSAVIEHKPGMPPALELAKPHLNAPPTVSTRRSVNPESQRNLGSGIFKSVNQESQRNLGSGVRSVEAKRSVIATAPVLQPQVQRQPVQQVRQSNIQVVESQMQQMQQPQQIQHAQRLQQIQAQQERVQKARRVQQQHQQQQVQLVNQQVQHQQQQQVQHQQQQQVQQAQGQHQQQHYQQRQAHVPVQPHQHIQAEQTQHQAHLEHQQKEEHHRSPHTQHYQSPQNEKFDQTHTHHHTYSPSQDYIHKSKLALDAQKEHLRSTSNQLSMHRESRGYSLKSNEMVQNNSLSSLSFSQNVKTQNIVDLSKVSGEAMNDSTKLFYNQYLNESSSYQERSNHNQHSNVDRVDMDAHRKYQTYDYDAYKAPTAHFESDKYSANTYSYQTTIKQNDGMSSPDLINDLRSMIGSSQNIYTASYGNAYEDKNQYNSYQAPSYGSEFNSYKHEESDHMTFFNKYAGSDTDKSNQYQINEVAPEKTVEELKFNRESLGEGLEMKHSMTYNYSERTYNAGAATHTIDNSEEYQVEIDPDLLKDMQGMK